MKKINVAEEIQNDIQMKLIPEFMAAINKIGDFYKEHTSGFNQYENNRAKPFLEIHFEINPIDFEKYQSSFIELRKFGKVDISQLRNEDEENCVSKPNIPMTKPSSHVEIEIYCNQIVFI